MNGIVARRVYVISDLHLGGTYGKTSKGRGFRMNTHVSELAEFVEALAQMPSDGLKIELVINGDMVDFLAEREDAPPYWTPFTCDAKAACAKRHGRRQTGKASADDDDVFRFHGHER